MANTNKKTLKDYFAELRTLAENSNRPDLVKFVDGRIEQIEKKNKSSSGEKKQTAKQVANEKLKAEILECMPSQTDDFDGYTVGEMIKEIPVLNGFSSSKVTALVHQLVKAELVKRVEVKGRAYFSKA